MADAASAFLGATSRPSPLVLRSAALRLLVGHSRYYIPRYLFLLPAFPALDLALPAAMAIAVASAANAAEMHFSPFLTAPFFYTAAMYMPSTLTSFAKRAATSACANG